MARFWIQSVYNVGDRVYYKDNGSDDTGTITEIQKTQKEDLVELYYLVKWDENDGPYSHGFNHSQLEKVEDEQD